MTKAKPRSKKLMSLEDCVHYIIFRELNTLCVSSPYVRATRICNELRRIVSYRSQTEDPKADEETRT